MAIATICHQLLGKLRVKGENGEGKGGERKKKVGGGREDKGEEEKRREEKGGEEEGEERRRREKRGRGEKDKSSYNELKRIFIHSRREVQSCRAVMQPPLYPQEHHEPPSSS